MMDLATRNALVEANLGLAASQARRAKLKVPESIQLEDLLQTGRVALITEASRYLAMEWDERGAPPFDAFARQRVYGAMMDSCRRRHYRNAKCVSLSGEASPHSIERPDYDARIDAERKRKALGQALRMLPERERKVVELHAASQNHRVIGQALGLSRDRTSQIHRGAIVMLKRGLAARQVTKAA